MQQVIGARVVPSSAHEDSDADPRHPEVVAVFRKDFRGDYHDVYAPWIFRGSGVVISPNVVLTAAHTVYGTAVDHGELAVRTGSDVTGNDGRRIAVAAAAWNLYQPADKSHDLALLVLAESLEVAPAALAASDQVERAATWRLAGYGANQPDGRGGQGRRRWMEGALERRTTPSADEIALVDPGGRIDTCEGDSGGPLYLEVDGHRRLAGVTSRPYQPVAGRRCGQGGVYVRIDRYLGWIRRTIRQLGGAVPPGL